MQKEFTEDVILAGLCVEVYDTTVQTPEWFKVPNITNVGDLGETAEKKEKTNLCDKIRKYSDGLQDAPDKSIEGQHIPTQSAGSLYYDEWVAQQRFYKLCRNRKEFMMRIKWHDGETSAFLFKSLGFITQSPNQAEWKMFTVAGVQNTRMLWSVDITGPDTVTESSTIDLAAATDPVDLELDQGTIDTTVWASSDELVATVDASGTVTGVAAGEVTITAEIRGVVGYHTVTVS